MAAVTFCWETVPPESGVKFNAIFSGPGAASSDSRYDPPKYGAWYGSPAAGPWVASYTQQ